MANEQLIYDLLKGKNTLKGELTKTQKLASLLDKSISGTASGFLNLKSALLGGFAIAGIGAAISKSVELKNSLIGLQSVARNTGADVSAITNAAKDLAKDGLVPLTDVSNSLKSLLATGFSGDEAITVFKSLREAAAFNRSGQLGLGEAIRGAADGIKNQNSIMVDNAGITRNLSLMYKDFASSIGTTAGKLSDAQKRQATLLGIQKEAASFQGDYNKLLDTFSGSLFRTKTSFGFLIASIGDLVTKSPEAKEFLGLFSTGLDLINTMVNDIDSKKISSLGEFLLITPAKFWVSLLTEASAPSSQLKEINADIAELSEELKIAEIQLKGYSKEWKGLEASIFQSESFDFSAKQVANLSFELQELKKSRDELFSEGGQEFVGPILQEGASKSKRVETPKVDQDAIDAEIKRQEELQKIKDQFTLLDEEKRLERQSFLGTAEEERFVALEKAVGREQAIKLQAAENLAGNEISILTAKLGKEKALLDAEIKAKADRNKKDLDLEKQKVANRRSTFATISALASSENSTLAAIGKAAGITQIAIDTPVAVAKAYAAFPPPFNFIAAGLVGAAMAAQATKIAGVKGFENGGFLGGPTSSGDQTIFAGNKDEVVLNKSQQAEFFNMANGRSSSNQEQSSRPLEITLNVDGRELAKVMRDLRTDGFVA